MTTSNANSGPSLAAMSTSAGVDPHQPKNDDPLRIPPISESAYLAHQARAAQDAMRHSLEGLKHSLTSAADVRLWTKQYPWIATATALAAGAAAGYALTPRDRDEFREMWEKLKEKMASVPSSGGAGAGAPPQAASPQSSILGSILREAIKLAGPLVATAVAAASDAKETRNEEQASATTTR